MIKSKKALVLKFEKQKTFVAQKNTFLKCTYGLNLLLKQATLSIQKPRRAFYPE